MTTTQRRAVAELTSAERIDQVFLISQPQLRTTSRGDFYIAAFLSDRTGRINGRMWQASEAIFQSLPAEGFVLVRGRTENYQGSLQLVIDAIQPVDSGEVDLGEFLPASGKDAAGMFAELTEILGQVKNPHLARLVRAFLDDEELMGRFKQAPAAAVLHHAYLGGLLEHTLSLLQLARRVLVHYGQLDADLVTVGLFLHDIGKTTELTFDLSFQYTDQGHFIGHLVKGALLVEEKVRQLDDSGADPFPQPLSDALMLIIVSHHGTREFGCPIVPATAEAFAVHFLDNLDSKLALVQAQIEKDPSSSNWTNYIRAIESPLFKGNLGRPSK